VSGRDPVEHLFHQANLNAQQNRRSSSAQMHLPTALIQHRGSSSAEPEHLQGGGRNRFKNLSQSVSIVSHRRASLHGNDPGRTHDSKPARRTAEILQPQAPPEE
jgi:hypothetical protein